VYTESRFSLPPCGAHFALEARQHRQPRGLAQKENTHGNWTDQDRVFVIPGIGRLVKAERKARIGRNPQTGAAIKIKAKTVVKFRVAKAAKDVIAPPKK